MVIFCQKSECLDVLIFHFGAAASRFSHPFLTGDIEKLYMYKIFRHCSYSAVYMANKNKYCGNIYVNMQPTSFISSTIFLRTL